MPARSVCLVALSLSEAGPGRFGGQVSVIRRHLPYHTIPCHTIPYHTIPYHTIPRFINGIYRYGMVWYGMVWYGMVYREAGLFLMDPFTEGCDGVDYPTLPPGRSKRLYV